MSLGNWLFRVWMGGAKGPVE